MAYVTNKKLGYDLPGFSKTDSDPVYLVKANLIDEDQLPMIGFNLMQAIDTSNGIALIFDLADAPKSWKIDLTVSNHLILFLKERTYDGFVDGAKTKVEPSSTELAYIKLFRDKELIGKTVAGGKFWYLNDMEMWKASPDFSFKYKDFDYNLLDNDICITNKDLFLRLVDKVKAGFGNSGGGGNGKGGYTGKSLSEKYQERANVAGRLAWAIIYPPEVVLDANAPLEKVAIECLGQMNEEQLAIFDRLMPSS